MKTVTRSAIICAMNASQYDQFVPLDEVKAEIDQLNRGIWHRNTDIAELTRKLATANKRADDQSALKQSALQQLINVRRELETEHEALKLVRASNSRASDTIVDLRARLEAAEAQLKYGGSPCVDLSGSISKFRTRQGGVYEFNPKTRQVMVDSREFEQMASQADAYRHGYGIPRYSGQACAQESYFPRPFSCDRDTLEVPRNSWEWLNNSLDGLKRGRMRFAEAIGAAEGEDIVEVAKQVKRTNIALVSEKARLQKLVVEAAADAQGAVLHPHLFNNVTEERDAFNNIIIDIRKALGFTVITNGRRIIAKAREIGPQMKRLENENTDLRSTLRQMNRTHDIQASELRDNRAVLQHHVETRNKLQNALDKISEAATQFVSKPYITAHLFDEAMALYWSIERAVKDTKPTTGAVGDRS